MFFLGHPVDKIPSEMEVALFSQFTLLTMLTMLSLLSLLTLLTRLTLLRLLRPLSFLGGIETPPLTLVITSSFGYSPPFVSVNGK